jgi:hypothetical protein
LQQRLRPFRDHLWRNLVVRGLSEDFPLHQFDFCPVRAASDNLLCVSIPAAPQLTKISVELGHRHFCGGVKTPCVKDLNEKPRKIAAGKLKAFQIAGIVQVAQKSGGRKQISATANRTR